ncbi:hypothetical protein KPL78_17845 [Roseomonas sp. HJA6]|uniref:Uncharacterized protein n=2 Tax=Roseomonas alba TaxID=2846776 RepID=A0ABS7AC30_9PROT|nr:hypothetical protein [Neoroseomonas alba]
MGGAKAQPDPNGKPTRPVGWEYRPSPGNQLPAFAYDLCPGCYYEDSALIAVTCPVGRVPEMTLHPPDNRAALTRLENQMVEISLVIDGFRHGFRLRVDLGPTGPLMTTPVPSEHPMFQALADGRMLVLAGPGGSVNIPLTGSGAAIRDWARACNAQVAAPPPRAAPAAPMMTLGPAPSRDPSSGSSSSSAAAAPAPAPAPVAPPAAPVAQGVPEATLRARFAAYLAREYSGIPRNGYAVQFVDLNGDGIAEALLDINYDSGWCGARNCPMDILDLSGAAARPLFGGLVASPGSRPLDSRTQGWRDVRLADGHVLRWRNGKYDW